MTGRSEQVLWHKCGSAIIQDSDGTFKTPAPSGSGELATVCEPVLTCPACGALLHDRDLYNTRSDIAREKLRDAGWYPDPGGLALLDDPLQRAGLIRTLQHLLDAMGNADLLAVYAVVMALGNDQG